MDGEQNILGGISKMCNEEIKVCNFEGFPNKDGKTRRGMRDIKTGNKMYG